MHLPIMFVYISSTCVHVCIYLQKCTCECVLHHGGEFSFTRFKDSLNFLLLNFVQIQWKICLSASSAGAFINCWMNIQDLTLLCCRFQCSSGWLFLCNWNSFKTTSCRKLTSIYNCNDHIGFCDIVYCFKCCTWRETGFHCAHVWYEICCWYLIWF